MFHILVTICPSDSEDPREATTLYGVLGLEHAVELARFCILELELEVTTLGSIISATQLSKSSEELAMGKDDE